MNRPLPYAASLVLLGCMVLGCMVLGCDGAISGTEPRPWSARDAGPPPAPGDPTFDLGTSPSDLIVAWPAAPRVADEVIAEDLAVANEAAARAGTRVRIRGALSGVVEIRASDVELAFESGASATGVWIANRLERIAIRGGRLGYVEVQVPGTYYPEQEFHREWMTSDLLIDRVEIDAADTAFLIRSGVRVAITNSRAHAVRYCVWFGDSADFDSSDIIIAGNEFVSDGPEATVRLVHVVRSATVANHLSNTLKHNYRIHGRSQLNWASRNVLIETGMMLGRLPEDSIGAQYFDDNVFYQRAPSMFEVDAAIPSLTARRNHAFTDVWDCFWCSASMPTGWVLEENTIEAYVAPPAL